MSLGVPKPVKEKKAKRPPMRTRKKNLIDDLDDLVSLIVRYRDGECVTLSGACYGPLTCSHYYDRSNWGIRWDLMNCNAQCSGHNRAHNDHQYAYGAYMTTRYGEGFAGRLMAQEMAYRAGSKAGCKYTEVELQEKLDELTAYFDALKHRSIYIEKG